MLKEIFLLVLVSCNLSKKLTVDQVQRQEPAKKSFKDEFERAAHAIVNKDVIELEQAIEKDPNIVYSSGPHDGKILLMIALEQEEKNSSKDALKDIIEILFERSDLSTIDKNGCSVLHYILFNKEYVERILKEGLEKNSNILKNTYSEGKTFLMIALEEKEKNLLTGQNSSFDKLDNIIELLFQGSVLNTLDSNKFSVLHYALFNGEYVERVLKDKKVNVNNQDNNANMTPLMKAVLRGYYDSVKILMNNKDIKPELKDACGRNILHYLVSGIFESPLLEKAFNSNTNFALKIVESYRKVCDLLKSSSRFEFEKALEDQDISGQTPVKSFNILIKDKSKEEENSIKIPSAHKMVYRTGTFKGIKEMQYWNGVKKTFGSLFKGKTKPLSDVLDLFQRE